MELVDLDATTRGYMLDEVRTDIAAGVLYLSPRMSARGREDYAGLLSDAAASRTPETLRNELRQHERLISRETYERNGQTPTRAVPRNASDTLAEGEFNRFFMRGLYARAVADGLEAVEVHRAKAVASPRPASTAMIGRLIEPQPLLDDLRSGQGVDTALRLPPGPNSGLSIRIDPGTVR